MVRYQCFGETLYNRKFYALIQIGKAIMTMNSKEKKMIRGKFGNSKLQPKIWPQIQNIAQENDLAHLKISIDTYK